MYYFCIIDNFIDQISALAQGRHWDEGSSPAQNYSSSTINQYSSTTSTGSGNYGNGGSYYNSSNAESGGYQSGGGYQSLDAQQPYRDQKEAFFARKQNENAMKPEYVFVILNFKLHIVKY